ncbi:MAG: YbgA family protein [Planctomycetota bacterium]|jgi:uncharacterized protein YbgA (DUF1722 family)/uncharacterized protein YbbK (DUF523 family)
MLKRKFFKPQVIISKCLGFESCRWNGAVISFPFAEKMSEYVDFVKVCPEKESGLGVPRDPVRVTGSSLKKRGMFQPATGKDVTAGMKKLCKDFFSKVKDPDGAILKSKSPSCGNYGVKIYSDKEATKSKEMGAGFFAERLLDKFPDLLVEDEGRLTNFTIREHFLTRLFVFSSFKAACANGKMADLVNFHSENKYLLMSYGQNIMRGMGRITANHDKKPIKVIWAEYGEELKKCFENPVRYSSHINTLQHIYGYFKDKLSDEEKSYFHNTLEEYRRGGLPLSVPVNVLKAWLIRFKDKYLSSQTIFQPYPDELLEITDSGKGRKLK